MIATLLTLCLSSTISGGQASDDFKVAVAFLAANEKLPVLSKEFEVPATLAELRKEFTDENYVVLDAGERVALVVDKRISLVSSEVNGAALLKELAKRPDPFAPVRIGDLSSEARKAAIATIDMIQPKEFRETSERSMENSYVALSASVFATIGSKGTSYAPDIPLLRDKRDEDAVRQTLAAHPVVKLDPSQRELANMKRDDSDVLLKQYGGDAFYPTEYLETAAARLSKYVKELRRDQADSFTEMETILNQIFKNQMGGARLGSAQRLSNLDGDLKRSFKASFLTNWKINQFESRDAAEIMLLRDDPVLFKPYLTLKWCTSKSERGTPTFYGVEIFRG